MDIAHDGPPLQVCTLLLRVRPNGTGRIWVDQRWLAGDKAVVQVSPVLAGRDGSGAQADDRED